MDKKVIVYRHINGISINGEEFLLDNNNKKIFESLKSVLDFFKVKNKEELEEIGIFTRNI